MITTTTLGGLLDVDSTQSTFDILVPPGTDVRYVGKHSTLPEWTVYAAELNGTTYFIPCHPGNVT